MSHSLALALICTFGAATAAAAPITSPAQSPAQSSTVATPNAAKATTAQTAQTAKVAKAAKAAKVAKAKQAARARIAKARIVKLRIAKARAAQVRVAKAAWRRTHPAAQPVPQVAQRSTGSSEPYITRPANGDQSPAHRYNMMSQADCLAELAARGVPFAREGESLGVRAPVRLTGPLRGVLYRTDQNPKARATTPYEVADCRLVLALDDFAVILASHDIVEVRHYSMWRPDRSLADGAEGKRHPGALAIDTGRFITRTGTVLDVDKHFNGAIDAKTCGEGASPDPVTPEAMKLRAILCDAVAMRLFNVVLTPNYDQPHHNHFHLEVTLGWKSFLVH